MRRSSQVLRSVLVLSFGAGLCGCVSVPPGDIQSIDTTSEFTSAAAGGKEPQNGTLNAVAADLEAHGGRQTALALYQNAALTSGDVASMVELGDAYNRADMHQDAIKSYRAALKKDPASATATAKLGLTLMKSGKSEEGVPLLRQAAASVRSASIYANLGVGELLNGSPDLATEALLKAQELAPADLDIATNLALAQAVNGNPELAVDGMRKVVNSVKASERHKSNYALVLALAGRTSEAKSLAPKDLSQAQVDTLIRRATRINAAADAKERAKILGTAS